MGDPVPKRTQARITKSRSNQKQRCQNITPGTATKEMVYLEVQRNCPNQMLKWQLPNWHPNTCVKRCTRQQMVLPQTNYRHASGSRSSLRNTGTNQAYQRTVPHRTATVPGQKRWGYFTPPVAGADFLAALVASCFLGALPPLLGPRHSLCKRE